MFTTIVASIIVDEENIVLDAERTFNDVYLSMVNILKCYYAIGSD